MLAAGMSTFNSAVNAAVRLALAPSAALWTTTRVLVVVVGVGADVDVCVGLALALAPDAGRERGAPRGQAAYWVKDLYLLFVNPSASARAQVCSRPRGGGGGALCA